MTQTPEEKEFQRKYGQIVAKAWSDPAFKARLISEPAAVLREHGIAAPASIEVRIVEEKDNVVYLPLPRQPSSDELSEDQLEQVAGGIILIGGSLNFGLKNLSLFNVNQRLI